MLSLDFIDDFTSHIIWQLSFSRLHLISLEFHLISLDSTQFPLISLDFTRIFLNYFPQLCSPLLQQILLQF